MNMNKPSLNCIMKTPALKLALALITMLTAVTLTSCDDDDYYNLQGCYQNSNYAFELYQFNYDGSGYYQVSPSEVYYFTDFNVTSGGYLTVNWYDPSDPYSSNWETVGAISITNSGDMFILDYYGGNSQGYLRISRRDDPIFF